MPAQAPKVLLLLAPAQHKPARDATAGVEQGPQGLGHARATKSRSTRPAAAVKVPTRKPAGPWPCPWWPWKAGVGAGVEGLEGGRP